MSKKKNFKKDVVIELYVNKHKSLEECCKILNTSRITLSKWMTENDISIDSHRKSSNPIIELSAKETQFISGCLLGDGHISKPCGNSSQFVYCSSQYEHVYYVYVKLQRLMVNECKDGPVKYEVYDIRTNKTYVGYKIRSQNNVTFYNLRKIWYPCGIKIIPDNIELTPEMVLIWYIGDGGLAHSKKNQNIKISTHCFTKSELEIIILPQLKDFEAHLTYAGQSEQYFIYIPRRKIPTFLSFIGTCPIKGYQYKWNIKPYIYKNVELNGVSDYSLKYPKIINDWKTGKYTIYKLSKKYNVPIRCIKDELTRKKIKWKPIDNKKRIIQCDLFDNPIKLWYSGQEIRRELGFNASLISMCCLGKRKNYKNYIWKFEKPEMSLGLA